MTLRASSTCGQVLRFSVVGSLTVLILVLLNFNLLGGRQVPSTYLTDLLDYGSFMHSAEAIEHGRNPYVYHPDLRPPPIEPESLNLNPPVSLIPFVALHQIDDHLGLDLMRITSLVALAVVLSLLKVRYSSGLITILCVVATGAVFNSLWFGQIYFYLALLSTLAWLLLERGHSVSAGILFGALIAFKPPFALIAVILALAGARRTAAATALAAIGISALALPLWGVDVYVQYADLLLGQQNDGYWPGGSLSLRAMFQAIAGTPELGTALSMVLVLASAVWAWRTKPDAMLAVAVAMAVALIASPISWHGYLVIFLPVLLSRPWGIPTWIGVLMFIQGSFSGIGILAIFAGLAFGEIRTPRRALRTTNLIGPGKTRPQPARSATAGSASPVGTSASSSISPTRTGEVGLH